MPRRTSQRAGVYTDTKICTMDVTRLRRLTDFQSVHGPWQDLSAGRPMQGWSWQSTWWANYGNAPDRGRELLTLVVSDGPRVVAIAPWLVDALPGRGRVIRFLGEDEVCTEHPTILCRAEDRRRATAALAEFLTDEYDAWDVLELAGIGEDDETVRELVSRLDQRGLTSIDRQLAFRCWKLPLPPSWEDYLSVLSKSHRTQLRRLEKRVLDAERIVAHRVADASQFDKAWEVLVELHQRRRQSLGEPGCFASRRFASFHQAVARQLFAGGQLGLMWCELAGKPLAAEYNLIGSDTVYAYQGGLNPDLLDEQPGRISTMLTIRWAIESGHSMFDFLRGDEPYKAHWRAQPVDAFTVRVVAERPMAQIREAAYQAVGSVRGWLKAGWQRVRVPARGAPAT